MGHINGFLQSVFRKLAAYEYIPKILSLIVAPGLLLFAGFNATRASMRSPFVVIRTTITEERHAEAAADHTSEEQFASMPGRCGALHATQLARFIQSAALKNGLPPALLLAVMYQESGLNPRAKSPKGAIGLMQLMPEVARELDVEYPTDPEENINAGAKLLASLLRTYRGDVALALAAYNAGAGSVNIAGGIPPFAETRRYVANIMAVRTLKPEWEVPKLVSAHVEEPSIPSGSTVPGTAKR
jgi:soluble lytic murein transglycosylase-like protein